jgi:glycosyltransferase involved in cell wall biosynthesis
VVHALFINDTSRNGGPGRTLFSILRHLDGRAIERSVVLPRAGVVSELLSSEVCLEQLLFEPGILENPFEPWHRPMERGDFQAHSMLRSLRLLGNTGRAARGLYRLARFIKRRKVDVIFCNGTSACFVGAALGLATRTPVLWHVFYSSVADAIRPLHRRLAASNAVTQMVCVSACTATQFEHCPDKVIVQHDAIDPTEYSPTCAEPSDIRKKLGLPANAVLFASQGRIVPKKGYLELIFAMAEARALLKPSEQAELHLLIIGDTPEDTPQNHLLECKAHATRLGLERNVHFLGFRNDVPALLLASDVVVIPSVYEDPLPRAVMEAMALGKPVLAHAVGGIPEMVVHERTGLLAPKHAGGSRSPLCEGILRYFRDPEARLKHGTAGRARILDAFHATSHGARIQEIILRVAERKSLR